MRDVIAEIQYERFQATIREKARKIIEADRVRMEDFRDIYGDAAVTADMAKVTDLKRKFAARETPEQRRIKEFATMFEGLILDQIDQSMWFGEGVSTVAASEYDDLMNGVDVIAHIDVDGTARSTMGLGIDVTFASYPRKKVDSILASIQKANATTIKYFENGDVRGQLKQVPRIILAVEGKNVEDLARIWTTEKRGLVRHPIILQLATQISTQLEAYEQFSRRVLGDGHAITDMYKRQYKLWDEILRDLDLDTLEHDPRAKSFLDNDRAHHGLMQILNGI
jgi:hypothetical protein